MAAGGLPPAEGLGGGGLGFFIAWSIAVDLGGMGPDWIASETRPDQVTPTTRQRSEAVGNDGDDEAARRFGALKVCVPKFTQIRLQGVFW